MRIRSIFLLRPNENVAFNLNTVGFLSPRIVFWIFSPDSSEFPFFSIRFFFGLLFFLCFSSFGPEKKIGTRSFVLDYFWWNCNFPWQVPFLPTAVLSRRQFLLTISAEVTFRQLKSFYTAWPQLFNSRRKHFRNKLSAGDGWDFYANRNLHFISRIKLYLVQRANFPPPPYIYTNHERLYVVYFFL